MTRQNNVLRNTRVKGEWVDSPFPDMVIPPITEDGYPSDYIVWTYYATGNTHVYSSAEYNSRHTTPLTVDFTITGDARGYTIYRDDDVYSYVTNTGTIGEPWNNTVTLTENGFYQLKTHYVATPEYELNVHAMGVNPTVTLVSDGSTITPPISLPVGTEYTVSLDQPIANVYWTRNGVSISEAPSTFTLTEATTHFINASESFGNVTLNVVGGTGFLSYDEAGNQPLNTEGLIDRSQTLYVHTTPTNSTYFRTGFLVNRNGTMETYPLEADIVKVLNGTTVITIVYGSSADDTSLVVLMDTGGAIVSGSTGTYGSHSRQTAGSIVTIDTTSQTYRTPRLIQVVTDGEQSTITPSTLPIQFTVPEGSETVVFIYFLDINLAHRGIRVNATSVAGTNMMPRNSNFLGLFQSNLSQEQLIDSVSVYNNNPVPRTSGTQLPTLIGGIGTSDTSNNISTNIGNVTVTGSADNMFLTVNQGGVDISFQPIINFTLTGSNAPMSFVNTSTTWRLFSDERSTNTTSFMILSGTLSQTIRNNGITMNINLNGVISTSSLTFPANTGSQTGNFYVLLHVRRDFTAYTTAVVYDRNTAVALIGTSASYMITESGKICTNTANRVVLDFPFVEGTVLHYPVNTYPNAVGEDAVLMVTGTGTGIWNAANTSNVMQSVVYRGSLANNALPSETGDILGSHFPVNIRPQVYTSGAHFASHGMFNRINVSLGPGNNILRLPNGDIIRMSGHWLSGAFVRNGASNAFTINRQGQIRDSIASFRNASGHFIVGIGFNLQPSLVLLNAFTDDMGNPVLVIAERNGSFVYRWTPGGTTTIDVAAFTGETTTSIRNNGSSIALLTNTWGYDLVSDTFVQSATPNFTSIPSGLVTGLNGLTFFNGRDTFVTATNGSCRIINESYPASIFPINTPFPMIPMTV